MQQTEEKIKDVETDVSNAKLQDTQSNASNVESFFDNAEDLTEQKSSENVVPFEEGMSEFRELLNEKDSNKIDGNDTLNQGVETEHQFTDLIKNDGLVTNFGQNLDDDLKPFTEDFSVEDVVNVAKPASYIIEDIEKKQAEIDAINKVESYFISKKELEYLLQDNANIKFYTKDTTGQISELTKYDADVVNNLDGLHDDELIEIAVPIGKKKDEYKIEQEDYSDEYNDDYNNFSGETNEEHKTTGEYFAHQDYDDDYEDDAPNEQTEDEKHLKEEMRAKFSGLKKIVDDLIEEGEYKHPDDILANYLQENFQDYLLAKKITGASHVKFADKLIPEELLETSDKHIEIVNLEQNLRKDVQKTSILVNRDLDMEIESIEIFCKCGEKTIIKFDEDAIQHDESSAEEDQEVVVKDKMHTEIVIDTLDLEPLNIREAMAEMKERNSMLVPADDIILQDDDDEDDDEDKDDAEDENDKEESDDKDEEV